MTLYAHTPNDAGVWHRLDEHVRAVADLAAEHARAFDSEDAAWWAGILHDAGKASTEFQAYLALCAREPDRRHTSTDHKGAGFLRAAEILEPLAVAVQAHHGGLLDNEELQTRWKEHLRREPFLRDVLDRFDALGVVPAERPAPRVPPFVERNVWALEFWLRMLFSALVDADHFDTERHRHPDRSALRGTDTSIPQLWEQFRQQQSAFVGAIDPALLESDVNRARAEIYDACIRAADGAPGFYRLTAPTGGGKTRSGLAFALAHATRHGQRRVIMAVPYLTITDQTARIVRSIFPDERVLLEHHSAAGHLADDEAGSQEVQEAWRRATAQDWNAPLIVTTMVQLFESLLGRSPSGCRKLHRIAQSVIILDEAQTIPSTLRAPVYDVLQELVRNYGVTVVLSTATQPALDTLPGEIQPTEIVPEPARLFRTLTRVQYRWPAPGAASWSWSDVADSMRGEPQALAIVNTVGDAAALFEALGRDDGHFHLSSRMCGAHRRDTVDEIRARLRRGERCRVVSTQVVEAGVDLDFPLLLRAIGPLDRIVQAAGRCNREGKLATGGTVIVFDPAEGGMPPGPYQLGAETTQLMRAMQPDGELDLDDPATATQYFRLLESRVDGDTPDIQRLRGGLNFETVATRFQLIPDDQAPVLVRYGGLDGKDTRAVDALVDDLNRAIADRDAGLVRALVRVAQPYLVNVRFRQISQLIQSGAVVELLDDLYLSPAAYDAQLGATFGRIDPEVLVI